MSLEKSQQGTLGYKISPGMSEGYQVVAMVAYDFWNNPTYVLELYIKCSGVYLLDGRHYMDPRDAF